MIFSTLAYSFLAAAALAESVTLHAVAKDGDYSSILTGYHEGAGFSYFVATEPGVVLNYDSNSLTQDVGNDITFRVGYFQGFLAIGSVFDPADITFNSDNVLETNLTFWACNNIQEPYSYSKTLKIIVYDEDKPNDTCIEVEIEKVAHADTSSSSAASSSLEASSSVLEVASTTQSVQPAVITANGAVAADARMVAGMAGVAGVAAMLI